MNTPAELTETAPTPVPRPVVLLVDDEPHVTAGLRRNLRHESFTILTACSGNEALAVLSERRVDAVVADEEMPGMKGTELLAQVAQQYPDVLRFMLTGKPSLETAVDAINRGSITRFFTKPIDPVDLGITLRHALQHKELMTQALRLLRRHREQSALLERLERDNPGISRLRRDGSGAILLEPDPPQDYESLIEQLKATLGD